MKKTSLHDLAIDISLKNNSWYQTSDVPEIERVLMEAEARGELHDIEGALRHNNIDYVNRYGYKITIPAYDDYKKSLPHKKVSMRGWSGAASINNDVDYAVLILARQERAGLYDL